MYWSAHYKYSKTKSTVNRKAQLHPNKNSQSPSRWSVSGGALFISRHNALCLLPRLRIVCSVAVVASGTLATAVRPKTKRCMSTVLVLYLVCNRTNSSPEKLCGFPTCIGCVWGEGTAELNVFTTYCIIHNRRKNS